MDNAFITQFFDWDRPDSAKARLLNRAFRLLGYKGKVVLPRSTGAMTTVEQRINLYHLLSQLLVFKVPGDVVEVGCREGSSAVLFEKVLSDYDPERRLHVFDAFVESTPEAILSNFKAHGLRPPAVHKGFAEQTMPQELPEKVAFSHVDLGLGHSAEAMAPVLTHCLHSIYPRMSPGAVCVMMDYCDPSMYERDGFCFPSSIRFPDQWNLYPVVKRVCDEFLSDKPEKMTALYSGEFSHGFFRKG